MKGLQFLQPGEGKISLTIRAIDDEHGDAIEVETRTGHVYVSESTVGQLASPWRLQGCLLFPLGTATGRCK